MDQLTKLLWPITCSLALPRRFSCNVATAYARIKKFRLIEAAQKGKKKKLRGGERRKQAGEISVLPAETCDFQTCGFRCSLNNSSQRIAILFHLL